ncbi:MAG TPA: UPF0182 family protein, partial [Gemmatimonadaceae bacterium]|nr:UPF0182 family protein [Gemmatimonadaceae bacterium]
VLLSGWTGQLRISFIAVTVIVILSVSIQEIIPWMVQRFTARETQIVRERPYSTTRADFTRRAYTPNASTYEALRKSGVSAALDSVVSDAASRQLLRQDSLVYPGARGTVLVADPQLDVAGQRLGDGIARLGYAWAYQAFDLLSDSVPRRARLVTVRDVRGRVRALAPVFTQGSMVEPLFHADTLYWKLELYSASSNYPLSQHYILAGEDRSYFRHAATALVNARTARVIFAADPAPDPIAQTWMTAFPNAADYRAPTIARELTTTPWSPVASDTTSAKGDSTFRAAVTRLYNRMRAALAASDLQAFGIAYDSLGALIGATHR